MIEQETLLSKYMSDESATYTTTLRQYNKKTISYKDNKAYKLASLDNNEYQTIAEGNNNGVY